MNTRWLTYPVGFAMLVAGCLLAAWSATNAQPPGAGRMRTVEGKIQRFTKSLSRETDGAKLDNGTWLHWPTRIRGRFTAILKEGDTVRATGRTEIGPFGDTHFEVERVINLRTKAKADNPDFAGPGRRPTG